MDSRFRGNDGVDVTDNEVTEDLDQQKADLLAEIAAADADALEAVRVRALGKTGTITALLKTLGGMSPDERQANAPAIQGLRAAVADAIADRKSALDAAALDVRLASEKLDMTLPVGAGAQGSVHPVSQVMDELAEIFADLGFAVATGPEIEDDWHNFTALNIPETHPARAMHDTFYFPDLDAEGRKMLLPTHTPMFHQIEGLVIDRGIHLGHLRWTLETFLKAFFERDDIVLRLRPSYFPFTEPSVEVDVGFSLVDGKRVLGGSGDAPGHAWMELLGSGMVNRQVIAMGGLDPDEWQGFAFGVGVDRLAMLKYGMDDLRAFFDGDVRWLRHYGFAFLDQPTLSAGVGARA